MSWIYLMKNGTAGLVKIGRAHDVASRHGQFATGNPEDLTVIAAIETDEASRGESFLHGMYQSRRRRGEFFALTDAEAAEGADLARRFLAEDMPAEREAKRLGDVECDAPAREPDEEERELHRELLDAREEKYRAEVKCARIENKLRVRTGTSEGLIGLVSWRRHTVTRFDEASFRREQPELHASYSRTGRHRTFRLLWA
jgi:Meiotically up-regulated gene 113